jgi:hypothetical protein
MSTLKTTYINNPDNGGTSNLELEHNGNISVGGGINASGVVTATSFSGTSATFTGNVSVGGTLTYEDVENVDSVGLITARSGIEVTGGNIVVGTATTIEDGNIDITGIVTATEFHGDGSNLTGRGTFTDKVSFDGSIAEVAGGTTVSYMITVVDKDSTHRYDGIGSTKTYKFDGLQSPFLQLTPGRSYRFNQSHSSNTGYPIAFYYDAEKTTQYTLNITSTGTPGTDGYTTLNVTDTTPAILHYQCSSQDLMGNAVNTNSKVAGGADFYGMLKEEVNVTAGKLSDNTNIDVENGMVHLFTTTETTTSTPNIRYNASTSLNSVMNIGEAITVTIVTTAAQVGYSSELTIDGSAVTGNWIGGSAPSTGGDGGVDIHTFNIIKTSSAPAFTVIANHSTTS